MPGPGPAASTACHARGSARTCPSRPVRLCHLEAVLLCSARGQEHLFPMRNLHPVREQDGQAFGFDVHAVCMNARGPHGRPAGRHAWAGSSV